MKVIEITEFGAPDVLQLAERSVPMPKAGEVLIKVTASGVNRPDVFQRKGAYAPPPGASDLPGLEVAGEIVGGAIEAEAPNPFGLKIGDRVCALLTGGGYAEYAVAPLAQCLPVPEGLSAIEAASLPETFFTVWSNVFDRAQLGAGEGGANEVLLVQGGSSGIGVTAIQIARALGFRVFATAGSDDKCRACEQLGAERGINYRTEDFVEVVKTLTNGRGVDVILDMVAGSYVSRELTALADGGRLVLIALLGGAKAELNLNEILRRRLTVTGSTLRPRPVAFKASIAAQLKARVWPCLEDGRIKPVVHRVFPAAQAADAHALMESSTHVGKIVLAWGDPV
ncbi:NAD(P)H-quinone oxidoreductase [Paraburkholderia bonniea]|uniref:NAD(P)H-quinone oxidoreductase n=1 Tax=Paraburkholderia bonniea TaxID=2152891 RepID=UPI0025722FFB|nr:NAD(P)H-quinone oxidoreductase [Paraburkholderia bonniea]WJF91596.1 NAD(P)H-quinone oxidoreductase [Paraburkholderia bonniea]WJF94915.1 NAD(P)H-quinone oxidoreductase [Paraburkholderia bonniea]